MNKILLRAYNWVLLVDLNHRVLKHMHTHTHTQRNILLIFEMVIIFNILTRMVGRVLQDVFVRYSRCTHLPRISIMSTIVIDIVSLHWKNFCFWCSRNPSISYLECNDYSERLQFDSNTFENAQWNGKEITDTNTQKKKTKYSKYRHTFIDREEKFDVLINAPLAIIHLPGMVYVCIRLYCRVHQSKRNSQSRFFL